MSNNRDAHTVKPAGKGAYAGKALSGQPRTHGTEAEFELGKLAGNEKARGERPAMDTNRRPRNRH